MMFKRKLPSPEVAARPVLKYISPYDQVWLAARYQDRDVAVADALVALGRDVTAHIHKFLGYGKTVYEVYLPPSLLREPMYNIPVKMFLHQGRETLINHVPQSAQKTFALNGYNHSVQGRQDILKWCETGSNNMHLPPKLVAFQVHVGSIGGDLAVGGTYDVVGDNSCVYANVPHRLFLSAFDALSELATTSSSSSRRRLDKRTKKRLPLDVLIVHQMEEDDTIVMQDNALRIQKRFLQEASLIWSRQRLEFTVLHEYIVYVGKVGSSTCPLSATSKLDYVRLLTVSTHVKVT
jgi:hypothetical protein